MTRDYGYAYCEGCRRWFERRAANSVCCDKCQPKRNIEKQRERHRKAMNKQRKCVFCETKFQSKSGKGKYCSDHLQLIRIKNLAVGWKKRHKKKVASQGEAYISLLNAMATTCPGPKVEDCSSCFFDTMCPQQKIDKRICCDAII